MRMGFAVVAAWLGAGALTVAALVPAAPAAQAAVEGSALVVLGDSFAANGFRWEADATECLRGDTSWPNQLSRLTGTANSPDFVDRSCSGAAIESDRGYSLVRETLDADHAGAFGPRTRMVAIQTRASCWSATRSSSPPARTRSA